MDTLLWMLGGTVTGALAGLALIAWIKSKDKRDS